jgi:quinone-modifying oxidoreductase subunit QmoA
MASLKQTTYVSEKFANDSDAKADVYYIDIRAIDRFEDFYQKVQKDEKVSFIKSKVANITVDKETGNPILNGNNLECQGTGKDMRYREAYDLVVLAVGMEPSVDFKALGVNLVVNEHGFIEPDASNGGMFAAGVAADALDVNRAAQHATAAALRAIQVVNKAAAAEG